MPKKRKAESPDQQKFKGHKDDPLAVEGREYILAKEAFTEASSKVKDKKDTLISLMDERNMTSIVVDGTKISRVHQEAKDNLKIEILD